MSKMTTITLPTERVLKACNEYLHNFEQRLIKEREDSIQIIMDSPTLCDKLFRRKITREVAEYRFSIEDVGPIRGGYWMDLIKDVKMMCEVSGVIEITLDAEITKCLKNYLKTD